MLRRFVLKPMLYLALLILLLIVSGLAYRSFSQWQLQQQTAITGAEGIESLESIAIRGDKQWIYLRGRKQSNPVMLFLHGGPGMTELPIARSFGLELEKHFTVVHWDQRGSGKSRTRPLDPAELSIGNYVADVIAMTNYLRSRFHQEKIYLVGHSWGSLLGVLSIRDQPEYYHAYVGIGQIANMMENERLSLAYVREAAKARGNEEALQELAPVDPMNYAHDMSQMQVQRKWLYWFGGGFRGIGVTELVWLYISSPEYSLVDLRNMLEGSNELPAHLWEEVMTVDLMRDAAHFEIPVYFLAGEFDYNTPSALAKEYMAILSAPHKELIEFPGAAHLLNVSAAERYQSVLIEKLLGVEVR